MIICLLGFIGSGKDTVARYISAKYDFKRESYASKVKDICSDLFSWPRHLLEGDSAESREWREQIDTWWAKKLGIHSFTPRMALQMIGTDVMRNHFHKDIWILALERKLTTTSQPIIISDCRFKNEIESMRAAGAKLIEIRSGNTPTWLNVARQANLGCVKSKHVMLTTYKDVHPSEWDWVGTQVDAVVDNSFSERTPQTWATLCERVDQVLKKERIL